MKVTLTKVTTIDIDLEKERERIRKIFDNETYRNALLNVIDVFEKEGYEKSADAYDALPYNEEDEYPLQESMGKWWWQINGHGFMWEDNIHTEHGMEIDCNN